MDAKQNEIQEEDVSEESDNACGVTKKVMKQEEKKLQECIDGIECEGLNITLMKSKKHFQKMQT